MSFDLAVWRPAEQQLTAAEASRIYLDLCSRPFQSFIPGPEMAAFVDAVVERYRAAQTTPDWPWAAEPDIAEGCAIMPIQSALAGYVFPIIRDLAQERALVCFDPQRSTVYQPTATGGSGGSGTLELADGRKISDPNQVLVEESIHGLSEENWFVILERRPNYYLQAGLGVPAGAPKGRYVIEYRDGSPDQHWRAFSSNLDDLLAAFLAYRQGGMEWTSGFSWKALGAS
jgi:hypothetical protein